MRGKIRLKLAGIAATAARTVNSGVAEPRPASSSLESRRLRHHWRLDISCPAARLCSKVSHRRTEGPGLAFSVGVKPGPPQARWNRGDCGVICSSVLWWPMTASSSLESRRLRLDQIHRTDLVFTRLKLAGIAATAAELERDKAKLEAPPQARWNRGDCGHC